MTPGEFVLLPDSPLSPIELRAAALDGEVIALGEAFLPIDAPVTAHARAASLAPLLLDARVVVADRSAAWVWGWGPAPAALTTCVAITARIPSPDRRRLRAREVVIDDDERCLLSTVPVTTALRTLIDLARHDADPGIVSLLAGGITAHGIPRGSIEAELDRRPSLSFVRPARTRLLAALSRVQAANPC